MQHVYKLTKCNSILVLIIFMKCRLKFAKVKLLGSILFQPFFKSVKIYS